MPNKSTLRYCGLSENEIEIYLIILELGESTVYKIAKRTKISRPNVYDIVSKLTEKGLVTSLIKNNKKYFKPVSPQKLIDLIEEKKEELEEKKEELTTQTLPFLNKLYKIKETQPIVEIFMGGEGLKNIINDIIRTKKDIWIFGGADINKLIDLVPNFLIKKLINEKKKLKIKTKMIYKKGIEPIKGWGYSYKIFNLRESLANYWVYGDRTIIGIWGKHPLFIRIISQEVANSFKQNIEIIWKSKKYK